MTNRRSTQFALALATLSVVATAAAQPLAHVAAAPVARPAAVSTGATGPVGDGTEGAPSARSIAVARPSVTAANAIARTPRSAAAIMAAPAVAGPVSKVHFAVTPLLTPDIPTGRDSLATSALHAIAAFKAFAHHPSLANLQRYVQRRNAVAAAAARRLGLSQSAMQQAWNRADTAHQMALLSAFTQIGVPYHRISRKPGVGFDCSGLTSWSWDQVGVNMSHVANAQIREIKNVTHDTAEAGDIAYFPGHAMMYLGVSTAIIHAPYTGRNVEIDVLSFRHSSTRYGDPLPGI